MSNDPQHRMSTSPVHNARSSHRQQQSGPREEFLTVEHAGRPEHTPDVEGVVLRIADGSVTFVHENGDEYVYDETELRSTLGDAA